MDSSNNNNQESLSLKEEIFEWLDTCVKTVVVTLGLFTFVFALSTVKQCSMFPTLDDNDKVIMYSFMYKPKYKDIIVITQPNARNHNLVKRVIATGGQTIDIDPKAGKVFIDGEELEEDYIYEPTFRVADVKFPVTVPKGYIFAMGDNRNNSADSRDAWVGMIDERYVRGKVVFRVWPIKKFGVVR
ncbi:MAG: signal peptidase I [Oscillospiraceae bacterium]|nr:signal peptidase I [Oscillospiraceae bacterium]